MDQMLFLLGLPGSGKSALGRHIKKYVFKKYRQRTYLFNDYGILKAKSDTDTENQFKPADSGGFDVLKLEVFDYALDKLEQLVNFTLKDASAYAKVTLVEFSRNDYQRAFRQFHLNFFQNAHFIYLNSDTETCKRRIRIRAAHPTYEDDYPVSEYIFKSYYYGDDGLCLPQTLKADYGIDERRVLTVNNYYRFGYVIKSVNKFIDTIVESRMLAGVSS